MYTAPYYLHHGKLYIIAESEAEHTLFTVNPDAGDSTLVKHPRGGHNCYNARDIERLQGRMKAILEDVRASKDGTVGSFPLWRTRVVLSEGSWRDRYVAREAQETKAWEERTRWL